MWIALLIAIIMPVLAGVLLLRVQVNGGMRDDSDVYDGRYR
jgi:hypothetical protein